MTNQAISGLYLGFHTSHNASVAALDERGGVQFATAEERYTKKKLQDGNPTRSLNDLYRFFPSANSSSFAKIAAVGTPLLQNILRNAHLAISSRFKNRNTAKSFSELTRRYIDKLSHGELKNYDRRSDGSAFGLNHTDIIDHHEAHCYSAYFPSGFEDTEIITLDGVGQCFSCTFHSAKGGRILPGRRYFYNDVTIGSDYEILTGLLGFNPDRHCGKITGLAAYGKHNDQCIEALQNFFNESWKRNRETNWFDRRFKAPETVFSELQNVGRKQFSQFSREDLAYAIQKISEEKIIKLILKNISNIDQKNICLAGGVFANVRINQKIKELGFKNIFVQPAMDDGGLSLGAAYGAIKNHQDITSKKIKNVFWGPSFSDSEIVEAIEKRKLPYEKHENINYVAAKLLSEGKLVARFNGRMEFGPRSLGNRSIFYQPTDKTVNDWLNKNLKRTEFMPFAPAVLYEDAEMCFPNIEGSDYAAEFMTITSDCSDFFKKLSPAVVHVDGTARPQLIKEENNPNFFETLWEYKKLTNIPTLINTSFNMHEAPIVCTPEDAIETFLNGHLEYLAIGKYLLKFSEAD